MQKFSDIDLYIIYIDKYRKRDYFRTIEIKEGNTDDVMYSIFFASYSYQISTAEAAGRGIIMNIQRDLVYGGETIWFESQ